MSPARRVAIYRTSLLPGSETFIRDQAMALNRWEPVLVGRRALANGLDLTGLHTEIVPYDSGLPGRLFRQWRWRPERSLIRYLRSTGARLVHAHFGTDATDIWPTVKSVGLPMVVTLHGYDISTHRSWWEAGHGGFFRREYPSRLLRMSHDPSVSFLAVSRPIAARAVDLGIPEEKVVVSHLGIDTNRFRPSGTPIDQRRNRVLFVGRMVEKKAPLLMVRAFVDILTRVPDAELVMIGAGPLLPKARALASSLNLPVHFLGAQTPESVQMNLHHSKVFCLPSVTAANGDTEGLPISVLEAMACGIPVVTSASGATGEAVLHGVNSFCFTENDRQMLCEHVTHLLSDRSLLRHISDEARSQAVRLFSISKSVTALQEHYSRTCS